ncbi:MAG: response regulator [Bryobacteraceae bacterium]|nr:response regulator [Bryobacteraceae bacterium]
MSGASQSVGVVHVVDDDAALRRALSRLLRGHGFSVETYESGADFLSRMPSHGFGCLLIDLRMPGMGGLELQEALNRAGNTLSMIFLSGNADVPHSVKAMKAGALDFLQKPFEEPQLLNAIRNAMERSLLTAEERGLRERNWAAFQSLTPRERQVCLLVCTGMLNKQIGGELGTREKTIKVQRGSVMKKLGVDSLAELVKLVEDLRRAGLVGGPAQR